jgi:phospholipid/cholesterol/gamma-HCH transport system substrate-binding protein
MISARANLAVVGAFVLAAIVSLVVALAFLAGRTGAIDLYWTEYANVTGLKFGSQVVFEGYPVGQVERIEPMQDGGQTRFRVELSVQSGWQIPDNSIARPVSPGVLSPQTISITAGTSGTLLEPGDRIVPAGGVDILSSISSAAGNFDELTDTGLLPLLDNLNRQISTFGELLDSDLRPMVQDLRVITGATAENWPTIAREAAVATTNLAQATDRVDRFMSPERIGAVDRLIQNVDRTAESLRSASEELNALVDAGGDDLLVGLQEFRYLTSTLARYAEPIGEEMDLTARNFRDFSRQLRQNPGVILRGAEPAPDPLAPLPPLSEPP